MIGFILGCSITMIALSLIAHRRESRLSKENKSLEIHLVLLKDSRDSLLSQRAEILELLYNYADEAYFEYIDGQRRAGL